MNNIKEFINSERFYKKGDINLMVFPSCPIKAITTEAITKFVSQYNESHSVKIHYPMGQSMDFKEYADALEQVTDIDTYPDIIIQCDYKSLFAPNFIKFRGEGYFIDVLQNKEVHPFYRTFDYKDPKGIYTILGASFPVIVIDKTILGDLPVPNSFQDLLKPIYHKKYSIHGHGTNSCDMTVVMHIYQRYGKKAALDFARSLHSLRHFSEVIKDIGKGKEDLSPISVVPEMFGDLLIKKENAQVVWPMDGSPLFPLYMTVKKAVTEEAKELIDFLTGAFMGQLWASASFASYHPEVKNKKYYGKPVHFIGWDLIYQDIYLMKASLEEEVLEIIRGCPADKADRPRMIC